MATGAGYSGKEWTCGIGIADIDAGSSAGAIGATTQVANVESMNLFRVSALNDIAWSGGYNAAEIERTGTRSMTSEDYMNHYGSGNWTWDFDYDVDNEVVIQALLQMIYPENGVTTTSLVVPAKPTYTTYAHGDNTGNNRNAVILLRNPLASKDRILHSAILQNLTLAQDAGTNGGLLKATGQFMSGYKPTITTDSTSVSEGDANFKKTIFQNTTHTLGGNEASFKSWSITIDNPASRVGYQGTSWEADGYVRSNPIKVTGSVVVKADSVVQGYLESKWQSNDVFAFAMNNGTTGFDISLPNCLMTNFSMDMADDGIFATLDFVATTGVDYGTAVATIKMT